jgi:integrase
MRRKKKHRPPGPYVRAGRFWADFRAYGDAGGRQEPLRADGEGLATTDPTVAATLYAARLRELEAARRDRSIHGLRKRAALQEYAASHLVKKAETGRVGRGWVASQQVWLERAVAFFGGTRALHRITVDDVGAWAAHLADTALPGGRPSGGTLRHHLNALSNLYRWAQSEGVVPPGYNPVAALMDKPTGRRVEAAWLETPDAAPLLEAARRPLPPVNGHPTAHAHPLLATFLLTGGRASEVLGLEVSDVSFERRTLTFRPNQFRRLKTLRSHRVVPLWPQLEEVLRPYTDQRVVERGGTLLFPAEDGGMVTDWRKLLDRIASRAGWKAGEIRSKMFRHTYCAARLQTLDGGAPVSVFTVSRELGHSSTAMVEKVYSHLGTMRHRSEVVEYRVEQHAATLGDRLTALAGGDL